MQRVFRTYNCYATVKTIFEYLILQVMKTSREFVTYKKVWFSKAHWFLFMKYKAMMIPNSDLFMLHNEESCDPCQFSIGYQYVLCNTMTYFPNMLMQMILQITNDILYA